MRPWMCVFDNTYFTDEQAGEQHHICPRCGGVMTKIGIAGEYEYRSALHQAERALMHAIKLFDANNLDATPNPDAVLQLLREALEETSRVLDIGRPPDMVGT